MMDRTRAGLAVLLCAGLYACELGVDDQAANVILPPGSLVYFGVNLDWDVDSPYEYGLRLGRSPAVYALFLGFPFSPGEIETMDRAMASIAAAEGIAMITLEPRGGLEAVTEEASRDLATRLVAYNEARVPVIVRFAHEMNGSWYEWCQQPAAYIRAFRRLSSAVRGTAPGSAMLWAPNYGGGYPFAGGAFGCAPSDPDFAALDTNADGSLTMEDDPYLPYYPGDDAVDWVGMTLYHWGNSYPWGANVVPEDGKFLAQLSGTYNGAIGDHRAVPDFYGLYAAGRGKPFAVTETAALYDAAAGSGAGELAIKRAWWGQVFDRAMLLSRPWIRMISWFEHVKIEAETGTAIDWRALGSESVAASFRADLPTDLLKFAGGR